MTMTTSHKIQNAVERLCRDNPDFNVVNKEIRGVTYPVFENAFGNMAEMFAECRVHGNLPFIVCGNTTLSFNQTYDESIKLAHALIEQYGINKGDRVALVMRNLPEWVIAYMAIISVGAIVVPMNGWWETDELSYALEHCGARLMIADQPRIERALSFVCKHQLPVISVNSIDWLTDVSKECLPLIKPWQEVLLGRSSSEMPCVAIDPEDRASILYTSGTTGHPKGAVSTHRSIVNTLWQWLALGAGVEELKGGDVPVPKGQAAALLTIPLFHVSGCNSLFLLSLIIGRKLVMMHKWNPEVALELIEKEKVTFFNGVPTMSMELMNAAQNSTRDYSSLLDVQAGGAARPPEQVKQLVETFPTATPTTGYGMTETNAIGAVLGQDDYLLRPASVGLPTKPIADIRLIDDSGQPVETGQRGEIQIKSSANIEGYWKNPEATAKTIQDGWLFTGDVGLFDSDGFLYIVDRKKDIIIRGGENISSNEVEAAIFDCPDVQEVAVFGAPDERLGEKVVAVIMPKVNGNFSEGELRKFLSTRLAAFKVPADIVVTREQLPRIASGKIFKRQLRDDFISSQ